MSRMKTQSTTDMAQHEELRVVVVAGLVYAAKQDRAQENAALCSSGIGGTADEMLELVGGGNVENQANIGRLVTPRAVGLSRAHPVRQIEEARELGSAGEEDKMLSTYTPSLPLPLPLPV